MGHFIYRSKTILKSSVKAFPVSFIPFFQGEQWTQSGGARNEHRFTGHLRDSESGNEYAGARYYSNVTGRWLSVDPVLGETGDLQRLNRYGYVLNDPVNYVDPGGTYPVGIRVKVVEQNCSFVNGDDGPITGKLVCKTMERDLGPLRFKLARPTRERFPHVPLPLSKKYGVQVECG